MTLTDTLKNNIVIVVCMAAIGAFGAGWQAHKEVFGENGRALEPATVAGPAKCPEVTAGPSSFNLEACRTALADEIKSRYLLKTDVERDFVMRTQVLHEFDDQWRYLAMPNTDGNQVAARLTQIGPPKNAVVVAYDGSANNTFHVWYRGQKTGTKYRYTYAPNDKLEDPPSMNVFLSENGVIPAGIGGLGSTPVPIYFTASN